MKIMTFTMFDVDKAAEVAKAGDKIAGIPGIKVLGMYACQGIPFPHKVPPHAMVVISIQEAESNEAIGTANYPVSLAGASTWNVPVLEMPLGGAADVEKEYRG